MPLLFLEIIGNESLAMAPATEMTPSNAIMRINGQPLLRKCPCPLRGKGSEAFSHVIDMSGRMYPREQIPVHFGGRV